MSGDAEETRSAGEGGRFWRFAYKYLAGPAEGVPNAVYGGSTEAREGWKRDLENRKRYSREQRERRRAEREARRNG